MTRITLGPEDFNSNSAPQQTKLDPVLQNFLASNNQEEGKSLLSEVLNIFGGNPEDYKGLSERDLNDLLIKYRQNNPKKHIEPISKEEADIIFKSLFCS